MASSCVCVYEFVCICDWLNGTIEFIHPANNIVELNHFYFSSFYITGLCARRPVWICIESDGVTNSVLLLNQMDLSYIPYEFSLRFANRMGVCDNAGNSMHFQRSVDNIFFFFIPFRLIQLNCVIYGETWLNRSFGVHDMEHFLLRLRCLVLAMQTHLCVMCVTCVCVCVRVWNVSGLC